MLDPIREVEGGIILEVNVMPNSKCNSIRFEGGIIRLKISSLPKDGKANKEIITYLSKNIGKTSIIRGSKSKKKTLYIEDVKREDIKRILEN